MIQQGQIKVQQEEIYQSRLSTQYLTSEQLQKVSQSDGKYIFGKISKITKNRLFIKYRGRNSQIITANIQIQINVQKKQSLLTLKKIVGVAILVAVHEEKTWFQIQHRKQKKDLVQFLRDLGFGGNNQLKQQLIQFQLAHVQSFRPPRNYMKQVAPFVAANSTFVSVVIIGLLLTVIL